MKQTEEAKCRNLFCVFAARGFSPEEAVWRSGMAVQDNARKAAELLGDARVRRQIAKLCRELAFCSPAAIARAGLERIALGDTGGALQVVLEEDVDTRMADSFHIAEIKRPKGGGVEVKFYDRLRALSILAGLGGQEDERAGSLLSALTKSAAEMGGAECERQI